MHGGEGFKARRGPYVREGSYPGAKRRSEATESEWRCPQHYLCSPFVQHILVLVEDYRHNRIGPVDEIPIALVHYLRIAVAELDEFKAFWETEMMSSSRRSPSA